MNKKQRREDRIKAVKERLNGSGVYVYENNTDADLSLPKPTKSGLKNIGPRERFEGDSYFLQLISPPMNLLKLIEVKEEAGSGVETAEVSEKVSEEKEPPPASVSKVVAQVVEKIKSLVKSKKSTKKKKKKVINKKKDNKMKEKLILDQPDIIKENGKSEPLLGQQVEETEALIIDPAGNVDVLLTEDPAGDVKIISE